MTYMSGSSSDPDLDRLNPRPAQPWVGALHPVRVLPRALTEGTTRPSPFTGRSSGASVARILSSFRAGSKVARKSRAASISRNDSSARRVSSTSTCGSRSTSSWACSRSGFVASARSAAPAWRVSVGRGSRRVNSAGRCWRASRRLPSWLQAGRDSSPRASPGCSRHVARPSCATGTACRRCPGCLRRPR